MSEIVTLHLDTAQPADFARNVRLGGLIDLELGDKSKWVLVYRTEDKRSFFVVPGKRVVPMEAADVLVAMGHGLAESLKKAKAGK